MKTFLVPKEQGESPVDYLYRVAGIPWQFSSGNRNITVEGTAVTLDGEQPEGAGFEEVTVVTEPIILTPPAPSVPYEVTMRQARLVLLGAGLLDDVEAAINALPSPIKEQARIEWDYSSTVQRHNGLVSQLGPLLGLTEAQLDSMFIAAKAIP